MVQVDDPGRRPLSEADIQAYADGVLCAERRNRAQRYLRDSPAEARRVAFYGRLNAQLQACFQAIDSVPAGHLPRMGRFFRLRRLRTDIGIEMTVRDELLEHVPRLRRYARALISNRDLADDLVQDTLERALRYADKFRLGSDLRAWLFTIMHNTFANQLRKSSGRGVHVSVNDESVAESEFAVSANQVQSLEVRDLDYALQRLPIDQREVVLMVGLEELSYAEVAIALDIPIGTVMSRLSRGRERLRALMSGNRPNARLKVVQ